MSTSVANITEAASKSVAGQAGRLHGGKYLTFFLDGEEYGLKIPAVQEIFCMMPVTPVPRTPAFIVGVINLRGKVIPVMDLRLKFGMAAKERTEETCIIVVRAAGLEMGLVVDKVSEVLDIGASDIEDAPTFGAEVKTDYLLGIGKADGKVKLLLDIDMVLASEEVTALFNTTVAAVHPGEQI